MDYGMKFLDYINFLFSLLTFNVMMKWLLSMLYDEKLIKGAHEEIIQI